MQTSPQHIQGLLKEHQVTSSLANSPQGMQSWSHNGGRSTSPWRLAERKLFNFNHYSNSSIIKIPPWNGHTQDRQRRPHPCACHEWICGLHLNSTQIKGPAHHMNGHGNHVSRWSASPADSPSGRRPTVRPTVRSVSGGTSWAGRSTRATTALAPPPKQCSPGGCRCRSQNDPWMRTTYFYNKKKVQETSTRYSSDGLFYFRRIILCWRSTKVRLRARTITAGNR